MNIYSFIKYLFNCYYNRYIEISYFFSLLRPLVSFQMCIHKHKSNININSDFKKIPFTNIYQAFYFKLCGPDDMLNFRENSHFSLLALHLSIILYYFLVSNFDPEDTSKVSNDLIIVDDVIMK